ncbi:MAG TPA: hypothetical protein VG370_09585, partial [Chloroflexota bacterium]|nr:hypothetical protein [Chloroflexota bacterium]
MKSTKRGSSGPDVTGSTAPKVNRRVVGGILLTTAALCFVACRAIITGGESSMAPTGDTAT